MDDTVLDVDQVENLIKFCLTKEEMELLKNYTGDKESLEKCEQVSEFKRSLNTVNSACNEAKKLASQYQKEADKCNSGMETCKEVRRKLKKHSAQMKLTAMWEIRARRERVEKKVAKSNAFPYFI
ncbi:formin-like protein 21b [Gossypium arboreum]|uniref:formin-like protein 21b n=1 Tax=Gossypium arboreum TaxID=29729 RepID=UPI0022F15968|nr:formin-like protein 21b [Gossypium arboreum]